MRISNTGLLKLVISKQISVLRMKICYVVKKIVFFFFSSNRVRKQHDDFTSLSVSRATFPASSCLCVPPNPHFFSFVEAAATLHKVFGRNRCKPLTTYEKPRFLCYRQGKQHKKKAVFYRKAKEMSITMEHSLWDLLLTLPSQNTRLLFDWICACGVLELLEHPHTWILSLESCWKF